MIKKIYDKCIVWAGHKYAKPLLKYFKPENILLTSECGFGHVPIEITRSKLKKLVEAAEILRKKY